MSGESKGAGDAVASLWEDVQCQRCGGTDRENKMILCDECDGTASLFLRLRIHTHTHTLTLLTYTHTHTHTHTHTLMLTHTHDGG